MSICPFCSLLCDSEQNGALESCPQRQKSLAELSSRRKEPAKPFALNRDFIHAASKWVQESSHVLVTGKVCSLEASRSLVEFARLHDATLDLKSSQNTFDWILAVQAQGTSTTTIAEARLRSDLVVILGTDDLLLKHPRVLHQLVEGTDVDSNRHLLFVGDFRPPVLDLIDSSIQSKFSKTEKITLKSCQFVSFFRACHSTLPMPDSSEFEALADTFAMAIDQAKYPVIIFSTASSIPHGQRFYSAINEWQSRLASTKRVHLLPLNSSSSVFTQACTWLTGFPGRIAFSNEVAEYDPVLHTAEKFSSQAFRQAAIIEIDESPTSATITVRCVRFDGTSDTIQAPTACPGIETSATMLKADSSTLLHVNVQSKSHTVSDLLRALSEKHL